MSPDHRTVILDGEYYENEILKRSTPQGMLQITLMPVQDMNMHLAFIRGCMAGWWTFADLSYGKIKVTVPSAALTDDGIAAGSVEKEELALIKIYLLTEAGKTRKRQLALKYPEPINSKPGMAPS